MRKVLLLLLSLKWLVIYIDIPSIKEYPVGGKQPKRSVVMSAILRRKASIVAGMIHKKKPPSLWFVPKIVLPKRRHTNFTPEQWKKFDHSLKAFSKKVIPNKN